MAKFHINGNGEAGACRAEKGNCPFGGENEHFTSADAAREHYEQQNSAAPRTISKSKKAAPVMPKKHTFGKPEFFDYRKESDRLEKERAKLGKEGNQDYRNKMDALYASVGSFNELTEARVAAALKAGHTGSLKDAVDSKAITARSPKIRLSDRRMSAIYSVGWLPEKQQEKFYSLPASYIDAFVSEREDRSLPPAGFKKLVDVAEEVHRNNPNFTPRAISVIRRVDRGKYYRGPHESIPQMQNTAPHTYSLLNEYAVQKYGDRSNEFWETVQSNSVNHPKLSDFARAEKEFDKKIAS